MNSTKNHSICIQEIEENDKKERQDTEDATDINYFLN